MKAVIADRIGGPEVLTVVDRDPNVPGPDEILIDVAAAAVNWIDVSAREGRLHQAGMLSIASGFGLGWDVAGTVAAFGSAVTGYELGDRVIGLRDLLFMPGSQAEQVALAANAVARAPRTVDLIRAAAIPLAGLTALRAIELARLAPGDWLLITGATGEVGRAVAGLARARAVRTVVQVRADDASPPSATHTVTDPDRLGRVVRALVPGGVDAVVDAANLGIGAHEALRSRGAFVALVRPFAPPPIRGTTVDVVEVYADAGDLAVVAGLVDQGVLEPRISASYPIDSAVEAYRAFEAGGARGRVVITANAPAA